MASTSICRKCSTTSTTCHKLCHIPPDDRPDRRRFLIVRFRLNMQPYLAEEPLSNTSYKLAISSIHQDTVRTAIESSSSKLLNGRPSTISTAEQTLPMKTRTIMAQLRTDHSRMLGQYMNRIDSTARNHCHDCGQSTHDTHHLFDCPSKSSTLLVEPLWTAPTAIAKHLNLRRANNSNQRSIWVSKWLFIIMMFNYGIELTQTLMTVKMLHPSNINSVCFHLDYNRMHKYTKSRLIFTHVIYDVCLKCIFI